MAGIVQLKRSSVSGRVPDTANVEVGEPVVNLADQLIFTKDGSNNIKVIGSGKLSGLSDVSNASPTSNQVLTWDSTISKWKPAAVTLESAVESGYVVDTFSGDGAANSFILSRSPYDLNSILVTIQGVKQRPTTDYTLSGNVLTFSQAPYDTDSIDIVHLGSGVAGVSSVNGQTGNVIITLDGIIESGYVLDTFSGDGSANTFILSRTPYNIDSLLVTIQGVKQRPLADYTLSGNVITFLQAPYDTDSIDVVHLGSGVAGVSSVNGQSGNVTVVTGNVAETTNLYYTNARVYANVTQIGFATNSSLSLKANITDLTTSNVSEGINLYYTDSKVYSNVLSLGYATNTNVAFKANVVDLTTANVVELSNLYFTNERVYSNVSAIGYATNSNVALKANVVDLTTANVLELTNLYFTNARVYSNVVELGYSTNAYVNSSLATKANIADLNTSNVVEGTNLYYTNARVYANVVELGYSTNAYVNTQLATKANVADLNTSNVVEGTNLYFTNARSRSAITVTGSATYDVNTGIINVLDAVFPTGDYGDLSSTIDAFGVSTALEYDCNAPGTLVEIDLEETI